MTRVAVVFHSDRGHTRVLAEMEQEMHQASAVLQFEKAARLRDEIHALNNLGLRGDVEKDMQPEVFQLEPRKGTSGLRKILGLEHKPRKIEGIDIAHLGGGETVASLVTFIDGLPFKPSYRRYRIRSVEGIDDFASIREVVARRRTPRATYRLQLNAGFTLYDAAALVGYLDALGVSDVYLSPILRARFP